MVDSKFTVYKRGKWCHINIWPKDPKDLSLLQDRFNFNKLKTKDKVVPQYTSLKKIPNSNKIKLTAII